MAWHSRPLDEVFQILGSRASGLDQAEVQKRLETYGHNRLRPPAKRHALLRYLAQFHNTLIYVLLATAAVTALLQHWIDTGVILGVVFINAAIGFIQEGKAEKALTAIQRMLKLQASVIRNGQRVLVDAGDLVPGDIVHLQSGDRVPADMRIFALKNLRIDEAALTGESVAVEKAVDAVGESTPLADRKCLAYTGTLVTYGQGTGVVVATGEATEIGRIGTMLAEVQALTTPLVRRLTQLGHWLTVAIITTGALTFAFGTLIKGIGTTEMFMAAVGLVVAAIPEGLPAIVTITLAIGVQRMAARNGIVRRLPAVETLGAVTVICSDKTGTLTRNEMTAQSVVTADNLLRVTGAGYDPRGSFRLGEQEVSAAEDPNLIRLARAGLLCNDAAIEHSDGHWKLVGDPTEGALVTLAMKAGMEPMFERQERPRTDIIPFESERQFMATLNHDHTGRGFINLKGSPERVLALCRRQADRGGDGPLNTEYWLDRVDELAAEGKRVLAVAAQRVSIEHRDLNYVDIEKGLTLLGLVGLIDPAREEALRAVEQCHAAGIRVKMITGDHAVTARAIGSQLGIGDGDRVLTGPDLDLIGDEALRAGARETDIFARVTPEHKLRLVEALQATGDVVAMTGDGVNDAPALKRADVGIAMGLNGTEAAKEAAEVVLADDNFASIANAVEEGRNIYDNVKKGILFILPTNAAEALIIMGAILLGELLPVTPVQILWVNMITAVTLALALAFEPAEGDVMKRPPRDPKEPLLTRMLIRRIVWVGVVIMAGAFALFQWYYAGGVHIDYARTVAVNTLVASEAFYLINTRYVDAPSCTRQGLLGNRYILIAIALVIVAQLAFTYAPPMQALFGTMAIGVSAWGLIILVGLALFAIVEIEKYFLRRWKPAEQIANARL